MRIAICDDEILQLELLKYYVEKWAKDRGINPSIELFQSAEAFHFEWLEDSSYDIILLDIQMAELSGIELAKLIREKDKHIQIIFVTAISDYIGEGYNVDAINYLIKPLSYKFYSINNFPNNLALLANTLLYFYISIISNRTINNIK